LRRSSSLSSVTRFRRRNGFLFVGMWPSPSDAGVRRRNFQAVHAELAPDRTRKRDELLEATGRHLAEARPRPDAFSRTTIPKPRLAQEDASRQGDGSIPPRFR
jgi:hypothetical protein